MDIKSTFLFCSIRSIAHQYLPIVYEQINKKFTDFDKSAWKDLEQVEAIQPYQTYWEINAGLANMVFDTETLKPIGTIFGRVCIEHYSHLNHITLSYYMCNVLSAANHDFVDSAPDKHKININDLDDKKKILPYLNQVESFFHTLPELFWDNIKWVNLNLENLMQDEKFCYIRK